MPILLFLFWIVLNGFKNNLVGNIEMLALGAVMSGAVSMFGYKYLGFTFKGEMRLFSKIFWILAYFAFLVKESFKANLFMTGMILGSKKHYDNTYDPGVAKFTTNLRTKAAKIMFASSIQSTPGTTLVEYEEGLYEVQSIKKEMAELRDSNFVQFLRKIEGRD